MTAVSRAFLVPRIRERADMQVGTYPTSGLFVEDAELKLMIDEGARALYDLVLEHQGRNYFTKVHSVNTVAGQSEYQLPQDFYQMVMLHGFNAGRYFDIYAYEPSDVVDLLNLGTSVGAPELVRYSFGGTQSAPGSPATTPFRILNLLPVPRQAFALTMIYVPSCIRADDTTQDVYYDGVSGWEEWIIWDCVAKMIAKQEGDPSFAMAQRQQVEARIVNLSGAMDRLHPPLAQDWQQARRAKATLRLPRWRGGGL